MGEQSNFCPHCGSSMPLQSNVCSVCGKAKSEAQGALYLKAGDLPAQDYRILAVESVQIDSVCYLAQQLSTGQNVVLREFLPRTLIQRTVTTDVTIRRGCETQYQTALDEFVRLWRTLRSLHEQAPLPQVQDVFFASGTAYAVETPLNCITLEDYLKTPDKLLSWDAACRIFRPVIRALGHLHACGVLHGAISPKTLLVATDGKLHIGGFSLTQTDAQTPEMHRVPTEGYAPLELYDNRHAPGAYTDVYSLAAAMAFAVTGDCIPSALRRAGQDGILFTAQAAELLTQQGVHLLGQALQLYPQHRTRTMEQFLQQMEQRTPTPAFVQQTVTDEANAAQKPAAEEDPTSPGLLALKVFLAAALVIALLFCTLYSTVLYDKLEVPLLDKAFAAFSFLPMNRDAQEPTQTTVPSVTQTSVVPMVEVPNFTSLNYGNIVGNTTFQRNFTLSFEFEESDELKKNQIIRQSIESGKQVEQGTAITIVVSSGKPEIVLTDVVGMQYVDAYELLTEKGFVVEKVMTENDGTHTIGEVCMMSQVAGLSFEKGTAVTLTVWDGAGVGEE